MQPMPPMGYQGHQMPPNVSSIWYFLYSIKMAMVTETKEFIELSAIVQNHPSRVSLFNSTSASHNFFVAPQINFGSFKSMGEPSGLQQ